MALGGENTFARSYKYNIRPSVLGPIGKLKAILYVIGGAL